MYVKLSFKSASIGSLGKFPRKKGIGDHLMLYTKPAISSMWSMATHSFSQKNR
jgi:hypothetical protein